MNFNPTRFFALIKRDWIINKKPLLLILLALPLLVFTICFIADQARDLNEQLLTDWFTGIIIFGGLIFTATIMWEFKSAPRRLQYLTIPASHLEKYLSRWLYTLILYPLFVSIVFFIASKVFNIPWSLEGQAILALKIYYLVHASQLMYAIWFNKFVILKSYLAFIVFAIVTSILACLMLMITFPEAINSTGLGITFDSSFEMQPNDWIKGFAEDTVLPILKFILWWVLPPFFWVVGYFKLTEKEA